MTPRTWAEDKVAKAVTGYQWNGRIRKSTVTLPAIAAKLLLAEHQRAARIVKLAYSTTWKKQDYLNEAYKEGRLHMAQDILAALQRGRTGRGK